MLESVKKIVHEIIIIDTGSSDNTINVIEKFITSSGLKGKVHSRAWKDFGYNKTEAMRIAERESFCDYLFFLDADNYVQGDLIFPDSLKDDWYSLKNKVGYNQEVFFWRQQLFKKGLDWKFIGSVHEYPFSVNAKKEGRVEGDYFLVETHEGFRNRGSLESKAENDILLLKKDLIEEPSNSRILFHLGQAYFCLNKFDDASSYFLDCFNNSFWDEEKFYALYMVGVSKLSAKKFIEAKENLLLAWAFRPTRLESVYELMKYYYEKNMFVEGYILGKLALPVLSSDDTFFVHQDIYDWRYFDLLSLFCFKLNLLNEAFGYLTEMINVPESEKQRIEQNKKMTS